MVFMETVTSGDSDGSVGRSGLRLFLWAFVAKELFFLVVLQGSFYLLPRFGLLYQVDGQAWGLREWYNLLFVISSAVGLVGAGLCAWGLFAYAHASRDRWTSSAMLAALICWGISLGWQLLNLVLFRLILGREMDADSSLVHLHTWGWYGALLAECLALALLGLVCQKASVRLGRSPPKALFAVLIVALGMSLLGALASRLLRLYPESDGSWFWLLNITALVENAVVLAMVWILLHIHLRHLTGAPDLGLVK
jgi:hypothetical protein